MDGTSDFLSHRVHWWRQQQKFMHKNCKQGQLMEKRWKTQCRWWLITMIIDNYENWLRLAHSQIKSSIAFFLFSSKKQIDSLSATEKFSINVGRQNIFVKPTRKK